MTPGDRLSLDAFLARLPEAEAAELRSAAARIDQHARVGETLDGIERRFLPWAGVGGCLFVVGIWLLLAAPGEQDLLSVLCLLVLPAVAACYTLAILPRTRADNAADAENREYFLPRGGLYFPPSSDPAVIVLVEWTPPPPRLPISEAPRDPRKPENLSDRSW